MLPRPACGTEASQTSPRCPVFRDHAGVFPTPAEVAMRNQPLYVAHFVAGIGFGFLFLLFSKDPDTSELFARMMAGSILFILGIVGMVEHLIGRRKRLPYVSRRRTLFMSAVDLLILMGFVVWVTLRYPDIPVKHFSGFYFVGLCILCHLLYVNLRFRIKKVLQEDQEGGEPEKQR